MSEKQLIINDNFSETRMAVLEKERLAELYIERRRERGMVGRIYLGIVTRVLPGMQAAFVNIGAERTAFLYGGDVVDPEAELDQPQNAEAMADLSPEELRERNQRQRRPIEKLLKEGQQIIVQVAKDPLGSKGARVTMFLSLPGRYLVIMPDFNHIGVSRRIEAPEERQRLTDLVKDIRPENVGVIIRTAAAGVAAPLLQKDLKYLLKTWRQVDAVRRRSTAPALIYQDLDLVLKITRDVYGEDVEKIVVDNVETYEELKKFLMATIPGAAKKLELYTEKTPIFDIYGVEIDIGRALSSRIDLPSGGYLVIDQTEALTVFDVNTGKYVGHANAHETILKTNLEAAKKVVAQLRIRNIGGIIVIDFIDMERLEDRERVYNALVEELKSDKAKTNVLRISELGLVQMTRKRTSESLERQLMEPCPFCDGRGHAKTPVTEAHDLLREIRRHALQTGHRRLLVRVRDDIRAWIERFEKPLLDQTVKELGLDLKFVSTDLQLRMLSEAPFEVLSP